LPNVIPPDERQRRNSCQWPDAARPTNRESTAAPTGSAHRRYGSMFSRKRSTISCSGVRATTFGASRRVTYRLTNSRAKNVMKNAEASPA
jgi:hypothetical protein